MISLTASGSTPGFILEPAGRAVVAEVRSVRSKQWKRAPLTLPLPSPFPSLLSPSIVWVLPAAVWPYAKTVPLYPSTMDRTTSRTAALKMSEEVEASLKTWSARVGEEGKGGSR